MVVGLLEAMIGSRTVQEHLRTLAERRGGQVKDMVTQVTKSFLMYVVDRAS
jgi:hypothetical protein